METLASVGWFLWLWLTAFSFLGLISTIYASVTNYYGETPNIFYGLLAVFALFITIGLFLLGMPTP